MLPLAVRAALDANALIQLWLPGGNTTLHDVLPLALRHWAASVRAEPLTVLCQLAAVTRTPLDRHSAVLAALAQWQHWPPAGTPPADVYHALVQYLVTTCGIALVPCCVPAEGSLYHLNEVVAAIALGLARRLTQDTARRVASLLKANKADAARSVAVMVPDGPDAITFCPAPMVPVDALPKLIAAALPPPRVLAACMRADILPSVLPWVYYVLEERRSAL